MVLPLHQSTFVASRRAPCQEGERSPTLSASHHSTMQSATASSHAHSQMMFLRSADLNSAASTFGRHSRQRASGPQTSESRVSQLCRARVRASWGQPMGVLSWCQQN